MSRNSSVQATSGLAEPDGAAELLLTSALVLAIKRGHKDVVRLLLEGHANADAMLLPLGAYTQAHTQVMLKLDT
eukprot:1137662-Pelagomonas_calceolata.AAC.2